MSQASIPSHAASSFSRNASDHGSAPKTPYRRDPVIRARSPSAPARSASSIANDGVQARPAAPRSASICTWKPGLPPDAGTTVAPRRSPP